MKKPVMYVMAFILSCALGMGLTLVMPVEAEAGPAICDPVSPWWWCPRCKEGPEWVYRRLSYGVIRNSSPIKGCDFVEYGCSPACYEQ